MRGQCPLHNRRVAAGGDGGDGDGGDDGCFHRSISTPLRRHLPETLTLLPPRRASPRLRAPTPRGRHLLAPRGRKSRRSVRVVLTVLGLSRAVLLLLLLFRAPFAKLVDVPFLAQFEVRARRVAGGTVPGRKETDKEAERRGQKRKKEYREGERGGERIKKEVVSVL